MTQRRDRFPAFGLMLHDMGNSYFSFKQFTVSQARSAMRVGTDYCSGLGAISVFRLKLWLRKGLNKLRGAYWMSVPVPESSL